MKVINTTVMVSSVPPCDANASGTVDIFDLILVDKCLVRSQFSISTNGDGEVNIFDLIVVAQCFGQGVAPSVVEQPVATFSMVESSIHLTEKEDNGSEKFSQGISMYKRNPKNTKTRRDRRDEQLS